MECIVTGAAGFIGSSLTERLLALGHRVRGIDCFVDYYPRALKEQNLLRARDHSSFQFVEANLLDLDLRNEFEGVDWIFHQAAQAGVRASWGEYFQSYVDNNVLATQRVLEACRRLAETKRHTVRKVVYASSSSVYGDAERFPTDEGVIPAPVSPYGVTKLAAEHLMRLYASEFSVPTVSLRYFTVYGPRQRPDMAFHRFARSAVRGEEIVVYGDGEQSRDFTFIDDIVAANIAAAERGPAAGVYNLGGGTQATINDILEMLEEMVGSLRIRKEERAAGDARKTRADCGAAIRDLGFSPQVPLSEGLRREVQWMEEMCRLGKYPS